MITGLSLLDLRGYTSLEAEFGSGPQLIWGPNAAGKTSLLEAMVLLAWGRSHRTSSDAELIRWGASLARVEGTIRTVSTDRTESLEVALTAPAGRGGGRKRIRVNGVPRRGTALLGILRVVIFAPEDMLLIAGSPSLRRATLDQMASQQWPAYGLALTTYGRALSQRNSLLRAIRAEEATRAELRYWDEPLLEAGGQVVDLRLRLLEELAGPLAAAHAEIAPDEPAALQLRYSTNAPPAPGETSRQALARRLVETADKEIWNGATLVGPHRDDLVFELADRDLAGFASRGQQRSAILAYKLAGLDLLTAADGSPPLLLLDDVFSELDPDRRAHLVRRIAALPQAFVTTTTPDDLAAELVLAATAWEVRAGEGHEGSRVLGPLRGADHQG